MKKLLFFFLAMTLIGCKNFEVKKLSSEQLVREELDQIDWERLDSYPSFDACEVYADKMEKKQCFEKEVTFHIMEFLQKHEVVLKDSIREQVELILVVPVEGKPALEAIMISPTLENKIPEIKDWLEESIAELPKIYPAEKRGIPVKSSYKLPLIIESN